jgi:EPS-associated MarR family transcriptional regulator
MASDKTPPDMTEDVRLQILRTLEQNPEFSQRQLAEHLGVSLGKANYCLKALVQVGWVKAGNFARSKNKTGYAYALTPKGMAEKAALTVQFLERKQQQYDQLRKEIEALKAEVKG